MDIIAVIFSLIVLLFSVIIHELAHGAVALSLGDPTAKYEGRLTINPLKHLDPFGSVLLPLLLLVVTAGHGPIFGWAKPVPINPYNFKDQKWGSVKVAIAGPSTNFLIGVVFSLLIRFLHLSLSSSFGQMIATIALYNFILSVFNLLPIPPLDGSWILLQIIPDSFWDFKNFLNKYGIWILMFLIFLGGLQGLDILVSYFFSLFTGMS